MTAATIAESTPLSNRVLGPVYHASRLSDGAHVLATPTGARYATVDDDGQAAWREHHQLSLGGNIALCESADEEARLIARLTVAVASFCPPYAAAGSPAPRLPRSAAWRAGPQRLGTTVAPAPRTAAASGS